MRTVRRRRLLYRSGVEYADFAVNHIEGCRHNCRFPCYARLIRRFDETTWGEPAVVQNTFELLEKELPALRDEIKTVYLSFATDPFMVGFEPASIMSIALIRRINRENIPCTVLTKGTYPTKEIRKLDPINQYGITLVTLDDNVRRHWEPGASPIEDRIEALEKLHKAGFKTWVSIEPWMTPNIVQEDLGRLLHRVSFVNKIVFGRGHYNRKITEFAACRVETLRNYYNAEADKVVRFCEQNGIQYHIKQGTIMSAPEEGLRSATLQCSSNQLSQKPRGARGSVGKLKRDSS